MVEGHPLLDEYAFEQLYEVATSTSSASNSLPTAVTSDPCSQEVPWTPDGMFRARAVATGQQLVLKHPYVEDGEGIPAHAVHELTMLKQLRHPCVVRLVNSHIVAHEAVCGWPQTHARLWLVFENFCMDLRSHLKMHGPLSGVQLSRSVQNCLQGLDYIHSGGISHRDLRPENLLVESRTGKLKIGGFASAVTCSKLAPRSLPYEATAIWYRAPELLLGQRQQGPACDIWSLACTVAVMSSGEPLFKGSSEVEIVLQMFDLLGAPAEVCNHSIEELQVYFAGAQGMLTIAGGFLRSSTPDIEREDRLHAVAVTATSAAVESQADAGWIAETALARRLRVRGHVGADFVGQMLRYDTAARPTARTLLRHPFFYDIRPKPELWAVASAVAYPGPTATPMLLAWENRRKRGCSFSRAFYRSLCEFICDEDMKC